MKHAITFILAVKDSRQGSNPESKPQLQHIHGRYLQIDPPRVLNFVCLNSVSVFDVFKGKFYTLEDSGAPPFILWSRFWCLHCLVPGSNDAFVTDVFNSNTQLLSVFFNLKCPKQSFLWIIWSQWPSSLRPSNFGFKNFDQNRNVMTSWEPKQCIERYSIWMKPLCWAVG